MYRTLTIFSILLPLGFTDVHASCANAEYVCSAGGWKDISGYKFTVPCCCCKYVPYPKCHTCDEEEVVFAKYCLNRTITIKEMHPHNPFAHTILHVKADSIEPVDEGCYF